MFKRTKLPQTPEEFDKLINHLASTYRLPDKAHAAAIISVAIRHLPNDVDRCTESYLVASVRKNIANHVCASVSNRLQHEAEVTQLVALCKANPNDMQARDALTAAAHEGSEVAKKGLKEVEEYEFTKED